MILLKNCLLFIKQQSHTRPTNMTKELKFNFSIVGKKIYLGLKYQGLTGNILMKQYLPIISSSYVCYFRGCRGNDCMVVGFTTTYAVRVYLR